ncbi:VOC family protein [Sphingomicrobium sediminis]|uniref:VOC family protein n=1 Tax=Sphingomicrobium sediminis TaxID=2950949 RepID=A0A9X2EM47_9SPHN|nr:VOC family protein [Sphingomicrobium sediminis]MCM8557909.1 VOC family protein [Sphingomicrobium sediminis]
MTSFLHSMIRVTDPEATVDFFKMLGLEERRRKDSEGGRFTLIFMGVPGEDAEIELTHNWDGESDDFGGGRNFGHLAFEVDDVYATCERLQQAGVTINRPPREGRMAFVKTPDGISIELLNKGGAQQPAEPWMSMDNEGSW